MGQAILTIITIVGILAFVGCIITVFAEVYSHQGRMTIESFTPESVARVSKRFFGLLLIGVSCMALNFIGRSQGWF